MVEPAIKKLYYSIGEVSELTGLKPYVLRYWETEFPLLNPTKNRAGNRIYRDRDIKVIFHIKYLLYDQKYTIDGARKQLKSFNPEEVGEPPTKKEKVIVQQVDGNREAEKLREMLREVKNGLNEIKKLLEE